MSLKTRRRTSRPPKLLAVASGGGHWVQLLRLRPAFEGADIVYASVHPSSREDVPGCRYYHFPDASRKRKAAFLLVVLRMLWIVVRVRPDVIVTTGSAPTLFCLGFGRLLGARTLWIDSIANVKQLSTSGGRAKRVANECVSQWPEVADANGLEYWGRTL